MTALSITGSGVFDVANNHVIINYAGGADPISTIAAYLASGYNNGTWTGPGINSSTSRPRTARRTASRLCRHAADPGNPAGLASGTIEIKYTLLGDADLDGIAFQRRRLPGIPSPPTSTKV